MATSPGGEESVVLLVEDDPAAIRLVEEAFEAVERTITLIVATDGVEAFDVLANRGEYAELPRPDLIILDLDLPEKNGQQVLAELQEDDGLRQIPVVVFSQTDDPETIAACYRHGANAYIVKPMEYEGTHSVVERLTDFWLGTIESPP